MVACEITSTPLVAGRWRHQCRHCGRDVSAPVPTATYTCRAPEKHEPCPHLGDRMANEDGGPASESVPCSSCGHNNGHKDFAVFECALFGECLPFYKPTDAQREQYAAEGGRVPLCHGCPHRAV